MEQFVGFLTKVEEIFGRISAFCVCRRSIFVNSRVLFEYAAICLELCRWIEDY